jgi:hypothetical protein
LFKSALHSLFYNPYPTGISKTFVVVLHLKPIPAKSNIGPPVPPLWDFSAGNNAGTFIAVIPLRIVVIFSNRGCCIGQQMVGRTWLESN